MLFNSAIFLFAFLPMVVLLYRGLLTLELFKTAKLFILLSSLFFYAYWKIEYLPLLMLSILTNYVVGRKILSQNSLYKFHYLIAGITFNVVLLGYFKYTGFLVGIIAAVSGNSYSVGEIILPLAISFFTFQQIAYLVDSYKGIAIEYSLLNYAVFVSFFPQLIAGPIVHHRQMMPQFSHLGSGDSVGQRALIAQGLFIFSIGLFKKVCVADTFAHFANVGFELGTLSQLDAWVTSLSYSIQLYYDFSGYSDMAIGAALLFGLKLPVNFRSPYRSSSIREFWRRWHITLSNWLKDYVFIPLGGSHNGLTRTCACLLMTFLVGGIWHGAGWTFVIWGVMHGTAVVAHRLWTVYGFVLPKALGWFLTFNFVNLTWVFFRSPDIPTALNIISCMFTFDYRPLSGIYIYQVISEADSPTLSALVPLLGQMVILTFPIFVATTVLLRNVYELSGYGQDVSKISMPRMCLSAVAASTAITGLLSGAPSAFLYFDF